MARLPRVVLPGIPHHVTQRGNGRQRTFFEDGDYALYLDLLAQAAVRARLVSRAEEWPWSSARALIAGEDDHVVKVAPALEYVDISSLPDAAMGHFGTSMVPFMSLRPNYRVARQLVGQ